MTDEQINIAIAEARGIVSRDEWGPLYKTMEGYVRGCPSYTTDLNATREAVLSLTTAQQEEYLKHLYRIMNGLKPDSYAHWSDYGGCDLAMFLPDPKQMCQAFLRTIGKWEST